MSNHIDMKGNIAQQGATQVNNVNFNIAHTTEDIDRLCLRTLRCPDSLVVKHRLKENKDKLLPQSIEWILQALEYKSWRDGNKLCLLWIKGGAGKGKTMMSIGIIERLLLRQDGSTVVTYFFCQNADYELNSLEAIIKGLILQLANRQEALKKCLRDRWDSMKNCFTENVTSWRTLWNILLEMLDQCNCQRVYIIVDALDECQDDGMADFLKLIVRNGLDQPSKIKWLLTSRPLDSAQRELLAGHDQVQVSLELNSERVSEAVKSYITEKVQELDRRARYGETLKREIETKLTIKAEDTFLWVSLVCKELESVHRDMALATIQSLPPGLQPFYDRIFHQLSEGEQADVKRYMRLLKVMMLVYRPLNVEEVGSVTGLTEEGDTIQVLVDQCASFIRMHENKIEFVHQSARDYLAGKDGKSILDSHGHYGHEDIVQNCLSFLLKYLKVNLIGLAQPDSTRESLKTEEHKRQIVVLDSVNYAATFWVQHFEDTMIIEGVRRKEGVVSTFLDRRLLEWLECLSLLDSLPQAIGALRTLANAVKNNNSVLMLLQDATRFLLRHYQILANWPLQTYRSALIFSPESSVVKKKNADKIPKWLRKTPLMEETWASLIQTLAGHSHSITAVAFSLDGQQIASGSRDKTVKLWDTASGELQKTLAGHSGWVTAIVFSPDGRQIASGSRDKTVKLWDTASGELQKTLAGHSGWITAVIFSPDGQQIVSSSHNQTIRLWDTASGELQKILTSYLDWATAVAFSPDGRQIASGSNNKTIKLWDTASGDLQKTLVGHSDSVTAVAFSPDGRQIVSGSNDKTVKLWNTASSDLQKTLVGHSDSVTAVAFSPDGRQIASGSNDKTIKLWDTASGDLQKTLVGHSDSVTAVAFSPDGRQIVSGSNDETIKLWDTAGSDLQKTLASHSGWVTAVAFSPDKRQIASGSHDKTIKLWDTASGDLQKTLAGHLGWITVVAFLPDGRQIASGSNDKTIKLWDTASGELQKTLAGHLDWITVIVFSPDGRQIASGSHDKTIKLWDTASGELQKTLAGHLGWVTAVAFSPDGQQIVSGSNDETVKLWDTASGDLQKTLVGHSDSVTAVAFSPDGRQIVSGSHDQTIKLWDSARFLNLSKYVGRTLGSRFKFHSWQEIKTSAPISALKVSADNQYLSTNIGLVRLRNIPPDRQVTNFDSLKDIYFGNQWIYYGVTPLLHLPSDFQSTCYAIQGDKLAIGFRNGQVWSFDIDRSTLQRTLS